MEQRPDIRRVRAEVLLSYLYPELVDKWRVECRGTFYRNYSEDILTYDPEREVVELSRDGLLRLLPPRLVSGNTISGNLKAHSQKEVEELRLLSELFVPLDSILFRLNMQLESIASDCILSYEAYILKEYYGYDVEQVENRYLKMLLPLLPFVAKLKVDYYAISSILSRIVGYNVNFKLDCYSQSDRADVILPRVIFSIIVDGLDAEEVVALNNDLTPLFNAIREWFIPIEQISEFRIREVKREDVKVSKRAIMSYNTKIDR